VVTSSETQVAQQLTGLGDHHGDMEWAAAGLTKPEVHKQIGALWCESKSSSWQSELVSREGSRGGGHGGDAGEGMHSTVETRRKNATSFFC
jgi:hypothetical protein